VLFITAPVFLRSFAGKSLPTQIYLEKATISPPRAKRRGKKLASKFIYWVTYLARNLPRPPNRECVYVLNLCVFWLPTFTWLSTHSPGNCIKFQLMKYVATRCRGVNLKRIWFMVSLFFLRGIWYLLVNIFSHSFWGKYIEDLNKNANPATLYTFWYNIIMAMPHISTKKVS